MPDINQVERSILGSRKYRDLHPSVVRRQVEGLIDRYNSDKALEQGVRKKLHQAFGAYLEGNWLRKFKVEIQKIDNADPASILKVSCRLMALHTSTRERAGILSEFCELLAEVVPEDARVLDLACGFNSLTLPAINQTRRFSYLGLDLHKGMLKQLKEFSDLAGLNARFEWSDILADDLPTTDVAMLLKLLPCLEHQETGSALALVNRIQAETLIVSYPTRSIGGADVGMESNYGIQIERIANKAGRSLTAYSSASEVFYVLR